MKRFLWTVVVGSLALGCSFDDSGNADTPAGPSDPSGPGADDPDAPPRPSVRIDAPGVWVLDTDALTLRDPNGDEAGAIELAVAADGSELAAVFGESIVIGAESVVRAIGARPVMLSSRTAISIRGAIDVSTYADSTGAGAHPSACGDGAPEPGEASHDGGGGGGGGALVGDGGNGGKGKITVAAKGGTPGLLLSTVPRGGCSGASGGVASEFSIAGIGGGGGGALWLVAGTSVDVYGVIDASGGGGAGGVNAGGGGGGGSGGAIRFDTPIAVAHAGSVLASNGGGGGEGGDPLVDATGDAGDDGLATDERAKGGKGAAPKGGDGGDAGFVDDVNGRNGHNSDVGGGGGGSAGLIWINADAVALDPAATISPTPLY